MDNVTTLRLVKHKKLLKRKYRDIPLLYIFSMVLNDFYGDTIPKKSPEDWNPVSLHNTDGIFDPKYKGPVYDIGGADQAYTEWDDCTGIEQTKKYIERIKRDWLESPCYLTEPLNKMNKVGVLSDHFIFTREIISENTIIIGMFHIASKTLERYLITDVKRVCELLIRVRGEFSRILGPPPQREEGIKFSKEKWLVKQPSTKERLMHLSELIHDASAFEITDIHVKTILEAFWNHEDNIYEFPEQKIS